MSSKSSKITLKLALLSMVVYLLASTIIQYPLTTLLRPLPIIFLFLYTFQQTSDGNKNWLLTALGFSLLGDIILTLPLERTLRIGVLAFILAQYAYICLFLKNAQFKNKRFAIFSVIFIFIAIGFYFLLPHLGEMKMTMIVYIGWISSMLFCALHLKQHSAPVTIGAFLFLLSALIFTANHFICANDKFISILVMYLYYAGQFLLVLGLLETKKSQETTYSFALT